MEEFPPTEGILMDYGSTEAPQPSPHISSNTTTVPRNEPREAISQRMKRNKNKKKCLIEGHIGQWKRAYYEGLKGSFEVSFGGISKVEGSQKRPFNLNPDVDVCGILRQHHKSHSRNEHTWPTRNFRIFREEITTSCAHTDGTNKGSPFKGRM